MATIKDMAEQFNISAHAIRFYEKEGLINIPRDDNGNRYFDEASIRRLKAITYYRNLDLSLKEIKSLFVDFHDHVKSLEVLREHLDNLNIKLRELEATRVYVEEKISLHELLLKMDEEGRTEEERRAAYEQFIAKRNSEE